MAFLKTRLLHYGNTRTSIVVVETPVLMMADVVTEDDGASSGYCFPWTGFMLARLTPIDAN